MKVEQPILAINAGGTVATGKTLAITDADALTEGGVIVPTSIVITRVLNALDLSQAIFVADVAYQVTAMRVVWGVAGGAGAVLSIEKLTGTTAPGGGTTMLTGTIDITATANTVTSGALVATASTLQLAAGNRIGVVLGGVLTGLLGCCVTVILKRI